MNENKLVQLFNSLDDDLVEEEINKLLEGVDIDMDSINKKANQKLSNKRKVKGKKRLAYVAAACLCIFSITAIYADDISQTIKSFFNKTPIYSTIVDGEAYYLKERYLLDDNNILESVMVYEGKLVMEITTDLNIEDELANISIIPKNNPNVVYSLGGYGGLSEEKNRYLFSFINGIEENYHIVPFKDFTFNIAGNAYEVSLEKAKSLDISSEIYMSDATVKSLEGVDIGARTMKDSDKLNIQLIASFEDKNLKLASFGGMKETTASYRWENLEDGSSLSSSSALIPEALYVFDEVGAKYKLEIPENPKGRPITIFETNAPKGQDLTLEIPSIIAGYHETIASLSLNIPNEGEVVLNKEIDFVIQKAIAKNIKRISPTSAEVEFQLNTGENQDIAIRSFYVHSEDIKKGNMTITDNKATMTLEFDENPSAVKLEISYPHFLMDGNWVIDIK